MKYLFVLTMLCALGRGAFLTAAEPEFLLHEIGRPGGNYFGQTSAVDVDKDGDLDFISGQQFGDVFWYENRGADDWRRYLIGRKALTDVGGAAFDVDGDGWIDQVSGGTWFRNPGNPREAAEWRRHENGATPTHDNLAADVDGDDNDGDLDVFSGGGPLTQGEHQWYLWENADGHGGDWKEHVIQRGQRTHESVCGDVDGDGDIDILTKPWNGDRHWFVENLASKTPNGAARRAAPVPATPGQTRSRKDCGHVFTYWEVVKRITRWIRSPHGAR